jgi:phosphoenolpyruvate synthase/pyruvate phosphate dikinase
MRHSELVSDIINGIAEDEYGDNNVELPIDDVVDVEEQQAVVEEEINAEEEKVMEENTGVLATVFVYPSIGGHTMYVKFKLD